MALKRKYSPPQPNRPRVHKVTFMLNDEEQKAVDRYLARYNIENKSRWYRGNNPFTYTQDTGRGLSYPLQRNRNEKMNPFNDEYFMKQALVEARAAADEGEVPVRCVVVCNNQIIARAHNQTERLNDPTAHAEMLAITAAVGVLGAKYLTNCSLYVTVEPCIMCAGAIGWSQLSTIVYGASDEKRGFQQYAPKAFHPKAIVKGSNGERVCGRDAEIL